MDLIGESETYGQDKDEIYPDNALTVSVFQDVQTQWRVGPQGVIGLDYNVLDFVYRTRGIKRDDREEVFEGIQVMEQAAMGALRRK